MAAPSPSGPRTVDADNAVLATPVDAALGSTRLLDPGGNRGQTLDVYQIALDHRCHRHMPSDENLERCLDCLNTLEIDQGDDALACRCLYLFADMTPL